MGRHEIRHAVCPSNAFSRRDDVFRQRRRRALGRLDGPQEEAGDRRGGVGSRYLPIMKRLNGFLRIAVAGATATACTTGWTGSPTSTPMPAPATSAFRIIESSS